MRSCMRAEKETRRCERILEAELTRPSSCIFSRSLILVDSAFVSYEETLWLLAISLLLGVGCSNGVPSSVVASLSPFSGVLPYTSAPQKRTESLRMNRFNRPTTHCIASTAYHIRYGTSYATIAAVMSSGFKFLHIKSVANWRHESTRCLDEALWPRYRRSKKSAQIYRQPILPDKA